MMPDPASILARTGLWAAELRQRGQIDDAKADRLAAVLSESFGERLDQEDDPLLVVMLCGPTAVGKSSLINALAGAPISLPGAGATTTAAVLYVHEQDDVSRLFAYGQRLGSREQPASQVVRHRRDELLHKVLIDTPDIDSVRLQHRELTARLVHAADLVLFVTSPEKYKNMRSASWVLEQRQQRALAFVLNKWDRQGLGRQSGQREAVAADFAQVLATEAFGRPLVFRISTLPAGDMSQSGLENDMPQLRAWLESGIDQSLASVIRQRRLRAAWSRLATAIDQAVPQTLSGHRLLTALDEAIVRHGALAERGLAAEALIVDVPGLEDGGLPPTPGLLGMWSRFWRRIGSAGASFRATGTAMLSIAARARGADTPAAGGVSVAATPFAAASIADLSGALDRAFEDAAVQGLALGPELQAWRAEILHIQTQLGALPLAVAGELGTRANRLTLRRVTGLLLVYGVEALILAVLCLAGVRVGLDFAHGTYAAQGLLTTVLLLLFVLLILGQTIGGAFFPPLRQQLRRGVGARARSLVKAALTQTQKRLQDHVAAVDRLAETGRDLLASIDQALLALDSGGDSAAAAARLFAEGPGVQALYGQGPEAQLAAIEKPVRSGVDTPDAEWPEATTANLEPQPSTANTDASALDNARTPSSSHQDQKRRPVFD